jgi:hypothetical protein
MDLGLTTRTAVVALMFFTPIAVFAQDMPPMAQNTEQKTPPSPSAGAAAQTTPTTPEGTEQKASPAASAAAAQNAPSAPPGTAPKTPIAPRTAATAENTAPTPPGTVAPSVVDTKSVRFDQKQLDQMLAPIALYPDQLVSQILMASTFPLQMVEAARWLENPSNAALKGDALVAALEPMNWDPSIKSIVAFPAIVKLLNKNIEWTNSLGVAFTNQQSDVMAQIQFLRHQARNAGHLASNDKIHCRDDGNNIVIEPAEPNVVYAPYYNPTVVYGTWPWPAYPPIYLSPYYYGLGPLDYAVAWAWGPGWPIIPAFWSWYGVNWGTGGIFVNGGGFSRLAFGHAAWGGGDWHHSGGFVAAGGGARVSGAARAGVAGSTGSRFGGTARVGGAGHWAGGRAGGITHASATRGYRGGHFGGGGGARFGGGGGHGGGGHGGGGHGGAHVAGGGGHGGGGHGGGGRHG